MPVLHRYDAETDTAGSCALGRYDPTSSSSVCPRCNIAAVAVPAMWPLKPATSGWNSGRALDPLMLNRPLHHPRILIAQVVPVMMMTLHMKGAG